MASCIFTEKQNTLFLEKMFAVNNIITKSGTLILVYKFRHLIVKSFLTETSLRTLNLISNIPSLSTSNILTANDACSISKVLWAQKVKSEVFITLRQFIDSTEVSIFFVRSAENFNALVQTWYEWEMPSKFKSHYCIRKYWGTAITTSLLL